MLYENLVHGYLNPIRGSRWGAPLLGLCEHETTHLGTLMYPKTTHAVMSKKKEGSEWSYTSEAAKFTRERCIRVAAIVIMITPGVSNIWGIEKIEKSKGLPSEITTKHTACNGSNVWNRIDPND